MKADDGAGGNHPEPASPASAGRRSLPRDGDRARRNKCLRAQLASASLPEIPTG